jgi:hypothetical protein
MKARYRKPYSSFMAWITLDRATQKGFKVAWSVIAPSPFNHEVIAAPMTRKPYSRLNANIRRKHNRWAKSFDYCGVSVYDYLADLEG